MGEAKRRGNYEERKANPTGIGRLLAMVPNWGGWRPSQGRGYRLGRAGNWLRGWRKSNKHLRRRQAAAVNRARRQNNGCN